MRQQRSCYGVTGYTFRSEQHECNEKDDPPDVAKVCLHLCVRLHLSRRPNPIQKEYKPTGGIDEYGCRHFAPVGLWTPRIDLRSSLALEREDGACSTTTSSPVCNGERSCPSR